eukprot:gene2882-1864_t
MNRQICCYCAGYWYRPGLLAVALENGFCYWMWTLDCAKDTINNKSRRFRAVQLLVFAFVCT